MTNERADGLPPRRFTWRFAFGVGWVGAIAVAGLEALVNRPAFADTQASGSIILIVISVPAVVLAIAVIEPIGLLIPTSLLSCAASALGAWSTMRDTSSTAAVGVIATPFIAAFIVGVGCTLALLWDFAARRRRREALVVSALASRTPRDPDRG